LAQLLEPQPSLGDPTPRPPQQAVPKKYRRAEGRAERYAVLAAELTRLDLDLIASNSTPAAQALQRATRDIPVVFMSVSDRALSGY
jgi:ABC-type uncharacterized transport system substrate-binding protein